MARRARAAMRQKSNQEKEASLLEIVTQVAYAWSPLEMQEACDRNDDFPRRRSPKIHVQAAFFCSVSVSNQHGLDSLAFLGLVLLGR